MAFRLFKVPIVSTEEHIKLRFALVCSLGGDGQVGNFSTAYCRCL
jgi:hypothetical protein